MSLVFTCKAYGTTKSPARNPRETCVVSIYEHTEKAVRIAW